MGWIIFYQTNWYGRPNPEDRINRKPKDRIHIRVETTSIHPILHSNCLVNFFTFSINTSWYTECSVDMRTHITTEVLWPKPSQVIKRLLSVHNSTSKPPRLDYSPKFDGLHFCSCVKMLTVGHLWRSPTALCYPNL